MIFYAEPDLLAMVREVSEDKMFDTLEFNKFLKMMSRQNQQDIQEEELLDAFKSIIIYFHSP